MNASGYAGASLVLATAILLAACDSDGSGATTDSGGSAGSAGAAGAGGAAGAPGASGAATATGGAAAAGGTGNTGAGGNAVSGGAANGGGAAGQSGSGGDGMSGQGGTGGSGTLTCPTQTPGSGSYTVDATGLTFTLSAGRLRLQVCKEDIVRIEYTTASSIPAKTSLSVSNTWATPSFCVAEAAGTVVSAN
jgi:alpha-D-xyloside xylohydrolase